MNWSKEKQQREERENKTLDETKLNMQKINFDELGIEIL